MISAQTLGVSARRHTTVAAFSVAAWLLAFGCGTDPELGSDQFGVTGGSQTPLVGLYTPGNTLGKSTAKSDADGGFTDRERAEAALRDSAGIQTCATPPADLGMSKEQSDTAKATKQDLGARIRTKSSLLMTFTTKQPGGKWKPGNVGAVWIEDVQNRPVRRLEVWAGERVGCLAFYLSKTCRDYVDVVASATRDNHLTPHKVTWDGKDFLGNVVPDGQYVIWIEVADVERVFGPRTTFMFTKGTQPVTMSIPDAPATSGLDFNYTPSLSDVTGDTKP